MDCSATARSAGFRRGLTAVVAGLAVVVASSTTAIAQPIDPYAPTPAPVAAKPPQEAPQKPPLTAERPAPVESVNAPGLGAAVAAAVVARAQILLDNHQPDGARQLALEALSLDASEDTQAHAHQIIDAAPTSSQPRPTDATVGPEGDAQDREIPLPPNTHEIVPPPKAAPMPWLGIGFGAGGGGLLGAAVGTWASNDSGGAAALGAVLGAGVGGAGGYLATRYLRLDDTQVRTIGSTGTWGATLGGLLVSVSAGTGSVSPDAVLGGALGGLAVGYLGGAALAHEHVFNEATITAADSFAGYGLVAGLDLGLVINPPHTAAYSLNAVFGVAGGWAVGAIAGAKLDISSRRMATIDAYAFAGAAAPWVAYPLISDSSSGADEQAMGVLSIIGLVSGAVLGWYETQGMPSGSVDKKPAATAPLGLAQRSSDGEWSFGAATIKPIGGDALSDIHTPGAIVNVAAGSF